MSRWRLCGISDQRNTTSRPSAKRDPRERAALRANRRRRQLEDTVILGGMVLDVQDGSQIPIQGDPNNPRSSRTSVIHPTRRERGLERLRDGRGCLLELGALGDVFDGGVGDREELKGGEGSAGGPNRAWVDWTAVSRGLCPRKKDSLYGRGLGGELVDTHI